MARRRSDIIDSEKIKERDEIPYWHELDGFEWKIHYLSFLSLGECDKYCCSLMCELLETKWYLELYLSSESKKDDERWFGLYLCKNDNSTRNIEFAFGIRSNDGLIHNIRSGKTDFRKNPYKAGIPKFLRLFSRKSPCGRRDTFNCTPDNCLTIFCALKECSSTTISEDQVGTIGVDTECNCSEDEESDDQEEQLKHGQGIAVLSEDMKKLFQFEKLCDVKIIVDGAELPAHKAILAARSPVFFAMFEHEMKEKKSDFVEISDSKLDVFKEFLHYLYTGNLQKDSLKHVCGVYVLADKYNVKQLAKECIDIMMEKLSIDNFCDFISLAIKYKESELLETTTEYFVENTKSILQTVQWQSFIAENPTVANELFLKTLSLK